MIPVRHRRPALLAVLAASGLLLGACSSDTADTAAPASQAPASSSAAGAATSGDAAAVLGIEGMEAKEAIETLDRTPKAAREQDVLASVRSDVLLLRGADGTEETVPMPEDEFYLSVAPYVNQTHECFYHSLTTCTGELQNTPVHVTVVDDRGETLVDEETTTYDNGFVGMWLPRDVSGTITVEAEGRTASMPLSTGAEDLTCNSQLQLT